MNINNKKSSLKEEGKINNFSFGKKNNKNSDEYKNNEEINLKDKDKYTNLKPYLANNNNQYNNIHFINNLDENNLNSNIEKDITNYNLFVEIITNFKKI